MNNAISTLRAMSAMCALSALLLVPTPGAAQTPSGPAPSATPSPNASMPNVTPPKKVVDVKRLAGNDRYGTAIAITKQLVGDQKAQQVYLASGETFPDAVSVTSLIANQLDKEPKTALLLTPKTGLTREVEEEIKRILMPGGQVTLLGGTAALSNEIEAQVKKLTGQSTIKRLAGPSRVETTLAMADAIDDKTKVVISPSDDFGISSVAAAFAGHEKVVHLVSPASMKELHPAVAAFLAQHKPKHVVVIGQQDFLANFKHDGLIRIDDRDKLKIPSHLCDLDAKEPCTDIGLLPANPAQVIAEKIVKLTFSTQGEFVLISHDTQVDGLAAGQIAVAKGAPILPLVTTNPGSVARYGYMAYREVKVPSYNIWVVGGQKVLSDNELDAITRVFKQ